MSERILVLGSNSFSGSHFIDHCLSDSNVEKVLGMSRSQEIQPVYLPYKKNNNLNKFQFQKADINSDLNALMKVVDEFRPDYFVNFAAQAMVAESWQHPEHWFQTNVVATVKLHDELRKRKWLKKYVHISTPEVYGSCSGTVSENTNYNPSTPYAVSRAAADLSLMSFFKNYQFPVVFTRSANVFGPGQQLFRIVPKAVLSIRLGKKIPLHGGGRSVRSFIHIKDVCDGTLKVAREAPAGEIYHFSTTRQISIRECVELVCARMDKNFNECVEITDDRPGKDQAYLLGTAKARNELQWKDQISLEQGIDETISWIDENLETIKTLPHDYIHKP